MGSAGQESRPCALGTGAPGGPTLQPPAADFIPQVSPHRRGVLRQGRRGQVTVAANLALALQRSGATVGLVDVDVYGPDIPLMMGARGGRACSRTRSSRSRPTASGSCRSGSGRRARGAGVARPDDPLGRAAVPPRRELGTARLPRVRHAARGPATPSSRSSQVDAAHRRRGRSPRRRTLTLLDVRKGARPCSAKLNVPVIGIVENMSYFVAPDTGKQLRASSAEGGGASGGRRSSACRCSAQIPLEMEHAQGRRRAACRSSVGPARRRRQAGRSGRSAAAVAERVRALATLTMLDASDEPGDRTPPGRAAGRGQQPAGSALPIFPLRTSTFFPHTDAPAPRLPRRATAAMITRLPRPRPAPRRGGAQAGLTRRLRGQAGRSRGRRGRGCASCGASASPPGASASSSGRERGYASIASCPTDTLYRVAAGDGAGRRGRRGAPGPRRWRPGSGAGAAADPAPRRGGPPAAGVRAVLVAVAGDPRGSDRLRADPGRRHVRQRLLEETDVEKRAPAVARRCARSACSRRLDREAVQRDELARSRCSRGTRGPGPRRRQSDGRRAMGLARRAHPRPSEQEMETRSRSASASARASGR